MTEEVIKFKKMFVSESTRDDQIYVRIDHFVGDYHLVLNMREGAEEGELLTNISIADRDWSRDKKTYWITMKGTYSPDFYAGSFAECKSLEVFNELIFRIRRDGEDGILEFSKNNPGMVTTAGI